MDKYVRDVILGLVKKSSSFIFSIPDFIPILTFYLTFLKLFCFRVATIFRHLSKQLPIFTHLEKDNF